MGLLRPEQINSQADVWNESVRVLVKYRFVIAIVFLSIFFTAFSLVQFLTEKYEAHASLLIKLGRENTQPPVTAGKGIVYTTGVRQEEINTYSEMLRSPSLIEKTVLAVGMDAFNFEPKRPDSLFGWVKFGVKKTVRFAKNQWREFLILIKLKKRLTDLEAIKKLIYLV